MPRVPSGMFNPRIIEIRSLIFERTGARATGAREIPEGGRRPFGAMFDMLVPTCCVGSKPSKHVRGDGSSKSRFQDGASKSMAEEQETETLPLRDGTLQGDRAVSSVPTDGDQCVVCNCN